MSSSGQLQEQGRTMEEHPPQEDNRRGPLSALMIRFSSHTFVRYCFIGGINGIVTYSLIFVLMVFFGLNYLVANVIGYAAGITTSFFLNKYANFKSDGRVHIELPIFVLSFLIAYSVNIMVLYIAVEWLNQSKLTGIIIASVVYSILFYLASRFLVFIKRTPDADMSGRN